ncbi:hypothetical protein AVEN_182221-1, partial [Araneus ventricosus]
KGPRNFETCTDDDFDTRTGTPSPNFHSTPAEGHLDDLTCTMPTYKADLPWTQESDFQLPVMKFRLCQGRTQGKTTCSYTAWAVNFVM